MTDSTPHANDPVAKAIAMLDMLTPDVRAKVLDRMDPSMRQRIQDRIDSTPENSRPHAAFSSDVARSQLMRESAQRINDRRLSEVEAVASGMDPLRSGAGADAHSDEPADPLAQLSRVHPAAVARAMQGERAEAWAIVLDRVNDNARNALLAYLDTGARDAITSARTKQDDLPIELRATIERAIARTIVPMALREQSYLLAASTPHTTGAQHGTAV